MLNQHNPTASPIEGKRFQTDQSTSAVPQPTVVPQPVADTKQFRVDLDGVLQRLKDAPHPATWTSRERALAITKIQEAIMWLGMDLKAMKEAGLSDAPNPYPSSYDPSSPTIEPTAQGLKL
ncbi:MAG TPA: hypothetical protein VHA37_04340 [Candidatus Saccharimonadales bacterium]|nr:hypothetical protein [Candidatus Saccharimonadales bacterium]